VRHANNWCAFPESGMPCEHCDAALPLPTAVSPLRVPDVSRRRKASCAGPGCLSEHQR
jgi:hypothetical protein